MPTIRLLVAVATRSGTFMNRCISGTFTSPPPMPRSADMTPANTAPTVPRRRFRTAYPGPDRAAMNAGNVPDADAMGAAGAGAAGPVAADGPLSGRVVGSGAGADAGRRSIVTIV